MRSVFQKKALNLIRDPDYAPMNARGIARHIGLPESEFFKLEDQLETWVADGVLVKVGARRFEAARLDNAVFGRVFPRPGGRGSVEPDDASMEPIAISAKDMRGAMRGDRVAVQVRKVERRGETSYRGVILQIVERARRTVVGTLRKSRGEFLLATEDSRLPPYFHVEITGSSPVKHARAGARAVLRIHDYGNDKTQPSGVLEAILDGASDDDEILTVIRTFDLPEAFPKDVMRQCGKIPETALPEQLKGRQDHRNAPVITIDPDDAKDFDDAIRVKRIENGWRLWVYIADVATYVTPNSPLDIEARRRGNSTYLVDRVLPMLPEKLSAGICSLRPKVDRLTKCVEFQIDSRGRIRSKKFYSSIIHSKRRLTYKEAEAILELKEEPKDAIERMIRDAWRLAGLLRKNRFKNGAINIETDDHKIRLDKDGRLERVEIEEPDPAHQLIEEFMLAANEAVAARLRERDQPGMYRVHKEPSADRLGELHETMTKAGVDCPRLSSMHSSLAELADTIRTHPARHILSVAFLRSLTRARYAAQPLGHFGLAKDDYTHFTSPIRRYADLIVHRLLFEGLDVPIEELSEIADHVSQTERNSDEAERASKRIKISAFLTRQLDSGDREKYNALVTDTGAFGLTIDIQELGVSGMIPRRVLERSRYRHNAKQESFVQTGSHNKLGFGSAVEVQVSKIDRSRGFLDFELIEAPRTESRRPKQAKKTHTSKSSRKKTASKSPSRARSSSKNRRR